MTVDGLMFLGSSEKERDDMMIFLMLNLFFFMSDLVFWIIVKLFQPTSIMIEAVPS